jgi:hypothetical protein
LPRQSGVYEEEKDSGQAGMTEHLSMSGEIMNKHVVTFLLVVLGFSLSSCGKKGDPGLPMPVVPDAPSKFQAVARAEGVFILWRAPDKNANETPLTDLAGFKIMRANEPIDKFCPRCPKNTAQLADIPYKGDRGKVPEKKLNYYQDAALEDGMVYFYQMNAYNEREKDGKSTKPLLVYWDKPPAGAVGLKADREGKLLKLSWQPVLESGSPVEGFAGYNVYRTTQQGVYDEGPINKEPVQKPAFEDAPEKIDMTYYYTVRSSRMVKETMIESSPSNELQVAYMDISAPDAPKSLVAIPRPGGVELKWLGSLQADIAGYNIYRREAGGFVRLNSQLVKQNSWLDASARPGGSYVYGVTTVDSSARANESPMSEHATVTYKLQ